MELIHPDWPAPANIRAVMTTRQGGISQPPWDSLNLGLNAGDREADVQANRQRLASAIGLEAGRIGWLRQVHGTDVVQVPYPQVGAPEADAAWTDQPLSACTVLTADCLPVLFCDSEGRQVAAAHAGWRGLAAGVLEATLKTFPEKANVMAWLGAAIGPESFEVGQDVLDAFVRQDAANARHFRPHPRHSGKYFANLYGLARTRLEAAGVSSIHGGDYCTYRESDRFFSYRRDGVTGRMASLIWRQ
ncbi:peptidoglycan editing factor PgeF [Marinobacteraceae bacterium S3BR75-40.1]